jgi:hypothetical protein
MTAKVKTESELEELLSRPDEETASAVAAMDGDLLILGAGGKMGPSLACLARRAIVQAGIEKQVFAVTRFTMTNCPRTHCAGDRNHRTSARPQFLDKLPVFQRHLQVPFGTSGEEHRRGL